MAESGQQFPESNARGEEKRTEIIGFGEGNWFLRGTETNGTLSDVGQWVQILDELHRYMDTCETEQLSELSGRAPTLEEYLESHMRTSAVGYTVGIDLGDTIRGDRYVRVVFAETVFNAAVLDEEQIHQDLQKAVDETCKMILHSILRLEEVTKQALYRHSDRQEDLTTWLEGCKNMCTGNMAWSLRIAR
ncbi:hypothetical protein B0H19DRAFT_1070801 [Mycena capillaripes]|nr:hypothetical protein B0H19DRAFT_1070801 [Mycena capillaripes]